MKVTEKRVIQQAKIINLDGQEENKYLDAMKRLTDSIKEFSWPSAQTIKIGGEQECLHKNCVGCKNGTCSGVHMLSCPCKSCSPWFC